MSKKNGPRPVEGSKLPAALQTALSSATCNKKLPYVPRLSLFASNAVIQSMDLQKTMERVFMTVVETKWFPVNDSFPLLTGSE